MASTYFNLDVTGDSEAVLVSWDPDMTSLADLMSAYVGHSSSDPSPPSSARYVRAILCADGAQADSVRKMCTFFGHACEVRVGWRWTPAEPYHRGYYDRTLGPPGGG